MPVTDVTDGRKFEQALYESERRLQEIINNAPVVLFALDRHGVFTLLEGRGLAATGGQNGVTVGISATEFFRDSPEMLAFLKRALAGEEFNTVVDYAGRAYDCHVRPILESGGQVAGVTGMIGVATDITERRRAELQSRRLLDELAQTGRISTLGEMASGLAHELNQPLAAIVAYVDACQELVESGKMDARQLSAVLQSVSSQAERAGKIIHRLRKMIRRNQPVRAGMSVNDAIRELSELMEAEARRTGAVIYLDLAADVPEIAADFLQIQQVILNLMRNGLEAMTDVAQDLRRLTIASKATAAGEVEVAVCDLGHGLNGATPDQVFEPFFTTKPNGLGLGLSISRTIVEAHGGRIAITTNATGGVTARFTLPRGNGKPTNDAKTDGVHR
jgi:PAS domain S-box-containing protein